MTSKEFKKACTEASRNEKCMRRNRCKEGCFYEKQGKEPDELYIWCNSLYRKGPCMHQRCDWSILTAEGEEDCPIYQEYMMGKSVEVRMIKYYKPVKPTPTGYELPNVATQEYLYRKEGLYEAEHEERVFYNEIDSMLDL